MKLIMIPFEFYFFIMRGNFFTTFSAITFNRLPSYTIFTNFTFSFFHFTFTFLIFTKLLQLFSLISIIFILILSSLNICLSEENIFSNSNPRWQAYHIDLENDVILISLKTLQLELKY